MSFARHAVLVGSFVALAGCGGGGDAFDVGIIPGENDASSADAAVDSASDADAANAAGAGGAGVAGGDGATAGGGNATGGGGAAAGGGDAAPDGDGALVCAAGVECTSFAAVLAAAPRDASDIANCAAQVHQLDCCGARAVYGINHGARTTLCPAETACVAQYASPAGCTSTTITADSGETTTSMADVRLRCVAQDGSANCRCETFVCTAGACLSAPGVTGGCG
jgi:hypothetical protein